MPELLKVIILGIVEGLTEFLPISSTGHLIVVAALLDFRSALGGTFEIFIQAGTVVAVIAFYRSDLFRQAATFSSDAKVRRLWLNILIAFIPAAVLGFLFGDKIKELLFNPTVVAVALIVGGIVFLLVENRFTSASTASLTDISPRQALAVGVAQILALIPGVSRSGASIVGGRVVGLERSVATQFSFYLAIPILGLATFYDLVKNLSKIQTGDVVNLALGAVVAGIVGWLSIRWLLSYIARNSFVMFGYYRIIAGVIILLLAGALHI